MNAFDLKNDDSNITSDLKNIIFIIPELFNVVERPSYLYRLFNKFRKDLSKMDTLEVGMYKKTGQWDSDFSKYYLIKKGQTEKTILLIRDSLILKLMELGKIEVIKV